MPKTAVQGAHLLTVSQTLHSFKHYYGSAFTLQNTIKGKCVSYSY